MWFFEFFTYRYLFVSPLVSVPDLRVPAPDIHASQLVQVPGMRIPAPGPAIPAVESLLPFVFCCGKLGFSTRKSFPEFYFRFALGFSIFFLLDGSLKNGHYVKYLKNVVVKPSLMGR